LFDESLNLFFSGHGLESLRQLHNLELLGQIFPATAAALAGSNAAAFGRLLGYTFTSTDDRIRSDKPVTPAFLFAAMLWEPVRSLAERLMADGSDPAVAWPVAVDRVMHEQAAHVAIPKRFVMATEEIWSLQSRFEQRQKKRVMRLLAHPKFRAAFDFLVIRAHDEPELQEQVEWWTGAQELDSENLSTHLAAAPMPRADGESPKKRKRSRRRKRRDASEDTAPAASVENHLE
jgi:poly(A) polymerase